jgi:hypothetical protein
MDDNVSNRSVRWPFRHLGSVTVVDVDEGVKFVDEVDVTIVVVVTLCIFVLDPVSRSFCWLFVITLDFRGASTYKFCTRSGPGLGATRLILTGA